DLSQGGNLLFCFPGAAGRQPGHQKDGQQKQIDTPFHGGSPPLRPVDLPLGTNRYIHDILCVVKLQVPVSGMAQGGAVRVEPVADDGAEILLDIAEALNAHGGKDSEALALEVLEHRAGVLPVVAVGPLPVRVKQDGSGTHQAAHLVKPSLGVRLDGFQALGAQADVPPGVTAEGPAGALELCDNRLHRLDLLLAVGLPLRGPLHILIRLGAVAQDALISRQAQAALGAEGGEVQVLFHKLVQDGDGVQVPGGHLIALGVLAPGGDLA
ncbi:peptidoglycan editing factor PgeF, partial [Dysosmobacter welbionis]